MRRLHSLRVMSPHPFVDSWRLFETITDWPEISNSLIFLRLDILHKQIVWKFCAPVAITLKVIMTTYKCNEWNQGVN